MKLVYPGGKKKALTFSYDDNQIHDRKLVHMMNDYGLHGTFHINAGFVGTKDAQKEFIGWEELAGLYIGHEVSCHGLHHPFMGQLPEGNRLYEILEDKKCLEQAVGYVVRGMSYPYGEYSDTVIQTIKTAGIEYSRTVQATGNLFWPTDFLRWHPTCHHNEAFHNKELLDKFNHPPGYLNLPLFYIWGHSFELNIDNTWDEIDRLFKCLSGREDVWYATNIQIKDYITAVRGLAYSVDQTMIYNPSSTTVYFLQEDSLIAIKPGETYRV